MLTPAQHKALAYDRSLCVTASAGTGKTHTLVTRYLHLLEESGCTPSEILALTFTDKAAAEMKDRLQKEIYQREGAFWDEIKDDWMWARVSTFHSFCRGLIREFSFESGLDRTAAVLDRAVQTTLIDDAIDRLFTRREHDDVRACTARCLVAWGEYQTREFLATLYEKRHISEPFFDRLASDPARIIATWQERITSIQEPLVAALNANAAFQAAVRALFDFSTGFGGEGDATARYLKAIGPHLDAVIANESPGTVCHALAGLASIKGGRTTMGSKKVFGSQTEALRASYVAMKAVVSALPVEILALDCDPDAPAMRAALRLTRDLSVAFSSFLRDVEQEKRKAGVIDYTDMINLAYALIKNNPSIGETLNRRYRFIMVDEFQDTDPIQSGIIMTILGFGEQNPSKLFVVGDPKQSIYLFRDADVTQFKKTRQRIERWGGDELPLDENFRSTPAVIHFVNALFERIFSEAGNPWDCAYNRVSHTEKRAHDQGSVELLFSSKGKNAVQSAIFEFDLMATRIGELVTSGEKAVYWDESGGHIDTPRPATYRDIAILIETRTHLVYLVQALSAQGIPFRVHKGVGFYQKDEIVDLCNILTFLCNPSDDIALYGALRSPYFGLSDAELFHCCNGRGRGLFCHLEGAQDERVRQSAVMLRRWLSGVRRLPPSEILQQILDDSAITIVYAALPDGSQRISNLDQICAYVRGMERAGFYTLDRLVRDLSLLVGTEDTEGEADAESDEDVVTIMTVHASKGLEFPIVWVPRLSEPMQTRSTSLIVDHALGIGVGIPSVTRAGKLDSSPPHALMKFINQEKESAEYKRLFYVATTRAKDHLILSGTVIDPDTVVEDPAQFKSRMQMLLSHLELSIPAEGESYHHTAIPGLTLTVSNVPSDGLTSISLQQREAIAPEIPDTRSFSEVPSFEARVKSADRIFSPSEIELYLQSPERHFERYVRKAPEITSLSVSALEDQAWTEGQIIHECFAGTPPGTVLRSRGLPVNEERVARYRALYQCFRSLPLIKDSRQQYVEFPFVLNLDGYRIQGVIDLLLKTADGWAVIDYKAGRAENPDRYALQLGVYQMAAEAITGEKVKGFLYFTETGELLGIEPDIDLIRTAVCRTCSHIFEGEHVSTH